jgi:DnaJ-class molecular chaperone
MARNYYVILGVPSDARPEEIHAAYRRLARTSHPDVSGAESGARFREVQEAWETLGDAERRRAYDRSLRRTPRQSSTPPESLTPGWYGVRPAPRAATFDASADLFEEPRGTYVSTESGQEIHFGLEMTAAEAATGGTMPLRIPVQTACLDCAGQGCYLFFFCPACHGTGLRCSWRTVTLEVPPGLRDQCTLEVPLAGLGLAYTRLILHVQIEPW